uniref:Dirigent protein n=1 Tax=Tetradesmus obliquus TaxID=3088 RepID=A0A383VX08_TETOB|eukprot:jgi/Sobl393_1/13464/SZX70008.1
MCAAQAEVAHGKGKPPTLGALSKLDIASKTYAWVARDKSYEYYRMKLSIVAGPDTWAIFNPINNSLNLQQSAISAKVFDAPTGAEIGAFDSVLTFTAAPITSPTIGAVITATVELGPDGNDSLTIVGSADVNITALINREGLVWVDSDFAVVGGTGRFNGAFGRHASKSTGVLSYETIVTAYVPRVREF